MRRNRGEHVRRERLVRGDEAARMLKINLSALMQAVEAGMVTPERREGRRVWFRPEELNQLDAELDKMVTT